MCLDFSQYGPKTKTNHNILTPGKEQGLHSTDVDKPLRPFLIHVGLPFSVSLI